MRVGKLGWSVVFVALAMACVNDKKDDLLDDIDEATQGDGDMGDGDMGDGDSGDGDGKGDGDSGDGDVPSTGDGDGPATGGDGDGPATGDGDGPATGDGDGPATGDGDGPATGDGDGPATGDGDGPITGDGDGPITGDGDGPVAECTEFEGFTPFEGVPSYTAEEVDTCLSVTCPATLSASERPVCIETKCGQDAVDFFNCQYANILACASDTEGPCRNQFTEMACCDVESGCPALGDAPTAEEQEAALACFNMECATQIAGWDACIDDIYASGSTAIPSRCLRPEVIGVGVCLAPSMPGDGGDDMPTPPPHVVNKRARLRALFGR